MILVFKTSVRTSRDINILKAYLCAISPQIKWNFDLEDVDNILRIECDEDISLKIIKLLENKGFKCEDLDSNVIFTE